MGMLIQPSRSSFVTVGTALGVASTIVLKPPLLVVEPNCRGTDRGLGDQPDGASGILAARGFPTMPISADLGSRGTNLFIHKM